MSSSSRFDLRGVAAQLPSDTDDQIITEAINTLSRAHARISGMGEDDLVYEVARKLYGSPIAGSKTRHVEDVIHRDLETNNGQLARLYTADGLIVPRQNFDRIIVAFKDNGTDSLFIDELFDSVPKRGPEETVEILHDIRKMVALGMLKDKGGLDLELKSNILYSPPRHIDDYEGLLTGVPSSFVHAYHDNERKTRRDNSPLTRRQSSTGRTASQTALAVADIAQQQQRKGKGPLEPSPYSEYMKEEIARVRAANPKLDRKEAFKVAASHWANARENPKNQAGERVHTGRVERWRSNNATSPPRTPEWTMPVFKDVRLSDYVERETTRILAADPELTQRQAYAMARANWDTSTAQRAANSPSGQFDFDDY